MNWVDALMLLVIAVSALAGFLRGFTRELLGLAAWIAAALLATHLSGALLPTARIWIQDPLIADVVCFTVAFVAILIALSILAGVLSRPVRRSLLGGLDRMLGAAFGVIRGAALLVLTYIVLAFVLPQQNWPGPVRAARALPFLHAGAHLALAQAPPRWRPALISPTPTGHESF